jgi:hypothetical protein
MQTLKSDIPRVDPNVQYVGVSKLRSLNATKLQELDKTLVIQDDEKPVAVVLSYEQFLGMQNERDRILRTLETVLTENKDDLLEALQNAREGSTIPISEVKKLLREGDKQSQQG